MSLKDKVDDAIASFAHDPADSPYQHGYLAALQWVKEQMDDDPLCLTQGVERAS
jgi:hypothetical protein